MKREELNLDEIERKTVEPFKAGKNLFGTEGAFAPYAADQLHLDLFNNILM